MNQQYTPSPDLTYTSTPSSVSPNSMEHPLVIAFIVVYAVGFMCCCFTCVRIGGCDFFFGLCKDPLEDLVETAVLPQDGICVVLERQESPPDTTVPRGIMIIDSDRPP